jgi:hypothetical protein
MTPSMYIPKKLTERRIWTHIRVQISIALVLTFSVSSSQLISCGYHVVPSLRTKNTLLKVENKTPFPALSVLISRTWEQGIDHCQATRLRLSLSNPIRVSNQISLEQSTLHLEIRLTDGTQRKEKELVTFLPLKSVTEEELLSAATYRLVNRMYTYCRLKLLENKSRP